MSGEMLEFEDGVIGEVFNLEEESVGAVIYGDYEKVKESTQVRSTGKMLTIPVGSELLGRVVNSLCIPMDGKGQITSFSETVIIMTSNLGAYQMLEPVIGERARQLVLAEVKNFFRPEFLNRLDEVIMFHRLTPEPLISRISSIRRT